MFPIVTLSPYSYIPQALQSHSLSASEGGQNTAITLAIIRSRCNMQIARSAEAKQFTSNRRAARSAKNNMKQIYTFLYKKFWGLFFANVNRCRSRRRRRCLPPSTCHGSKQSSTRLATGSSLSNKYPFGIRATHLIVVGAALHWADWRMPVGKWRLWWLASWAARVEPRFAQLKLNK